MHLIFVNWTKHNEKRKTALKNFSSATQKIHKCMMLSILIGFDFLFAYTFSFEWRAARLKMRFSSRWKVAVYMCVQAHTCVLGIWCVIAATIICITRIVCSERAKQTRQLTKSFLFSFFFFHFSLLMSYFYWHREHFMTNGWNHIHLNDGDGDPTFEWRKKNNNNNRK